MSTNISSQIEFIKSRKRIITYRKVSRIHSKRSVPILQLPLKVKLFGTFRKIVAESKQKHPKHCRTVLLIGDCQNIEKGLRKAIACKAKDNLGSQKYKEKI